MEAPGEKAEQFGPFVLLRTLGVGGMGTAHLAVHPGTEGLLVVKRMHPTMVSEPTLFKRFVHEAEVASHVQHPNVAALVAMGAVEGEPFLATEYVFGIQVSQIVDRVTQAAVDQLPLQVGLRVAVELAAGLKAIHEARHRETGAPLGLVHRDVGARNVLVGFDGRVRLIDLGLGKSILADWQTSAQVLAGSPDYMPPEQAMGSTVDHRADVYAAAVTVWELMTGVKRIREDSVAARVQRAVAASPEPLRRWRPDASRGLERLLQHAMAPDPDHRLSSAAELKAGFEGELRRLRWFDQRDAVRTWLDAACATIIARERRLIDQLRASVSDLGEPPSHVEMFVGEVRGWVPPQSEPDVSAPPSPSSARLVGSVAEGLAATAVRLGVPGGLTHTPVVHLLAVFVSFVSVVCLAAAATVWWLLPAPAGSGVPTTLPTRARPVAPVAREPARLGSTMPTDSAKTDRIKNAVSADATSSARLTPSPDARSPARATSRLQARKAALLVRLKDLRKVKYDVRWQRKLTGLSARLSRARTRREIAAIEVALNRLEKSRSDP